MAASESVKQLNALSLSHSSAKCQQISLGRSPVRVPFFPIQTHEFTPKSSVVSRLQLKLNLTGNANRGLGKRVGTRVSVQAQNPASSNVPTAVSDSSGESPLAAPLPPSQRDVDGSDGILQGKESGIKIGANSGSKAGPNAGSIKSMSGQNSGSNTGPRTRLNTRSEGAGVVGALPGNEGGQGIMTMDGAGRKKHNPPTGADGPSAGEPAVADMMDMVKDAEQNIVLLSNIRAKAMHELLRARRDNEILQSQLRTFQAKLAESDAKLNLAALAKEKSAMLENQLQNLEEKMRKGKDPGERTGVLSAADVSKLREETVSLQRRLVESESRQVSLRKTADENTSLRKELERAGFELETMRKREQETLVRFRRETEEMRNGLMLLKKRLGESERRAREREEEGKRRVEAEKSIEELKGRLKENEGKVALAMERAKSSEEANRILEAQLETLSAEKSALKIEINRFATLVEEREREEGQGMDALSRERERIRRENAVLQEKVALLEEREKELVAMEEGMRTLEEEMLLLRGYLSQAETLEKAAIELTKQNRALKRRVNELEGGLVAIRQQQQREREGVAALRREWETEREKEREKERSQQREAEKQEAARPGEARGEEEDRRGAEREAEKAEEEEREAVLLRRQVSLLKEELVKTDELMRTQLEVYQSEIEAFQESLWSLGIDPDTGLMVANAAASESDKSESGSGSDTDSATPAAQAGVPVVPPSPSSFQVPVGEMPWEFWSGLLLRIDELMLRNYVSKAQADELREMTWKRDSRIRDAWLEMMVNSGATATRTAYSPSSSSSLSSSSSHLSLSATQEGGGEKATIASVTLSDGDVASRLSSLIRGKSKQGIHIVHISAEMAPVAKVGGLADVVTGLGKSLQRKGHLVEVILPKYDCMDYSRIKDLKVVDVDIPSLFDGEMHPNRIWRGIVEGLPVYFIEPHHPARFFWRGEFYGCDDDFQRFTFFSRAALEFLKRANKRPDIIHCHDWQTAVVAPLYWDVFAKAGFNSAQVVLTCHNFEYQGTAHASALASCGLSPQLYHRPDRMQDNNIADRVNLLKGGIVFSNLITTVSPTYAAEVRSPEMGRGLQATLGANEEKFFGVLNGIDVDVWDPETDPLIEHPYSSENMEEGKFLNKTELKARLGLSSKGEDVDRPLIGCVTRLVPQKGVHLIRHAIYRTLERGGQFVLLGNSPVPDIQRDFESIARQFDKHPHIRLILKYDEALSHLIYAGSDMFIIPSMFEPCGLTQLIAMRYGAIPIARKTGGLADSVFDVDDPHIQDELKNGFTFSATDIQGLNYALDRAVDYYFSSAEWWDELVRNTMRMDFSWEESSEHYVKLYRQTIEQKTV